MPPGCKHRSSRWSTATGSGRYIKIQRPTTASKSSSKPWALHVPFEEIHISPPRGAYARPRCLQDGRVRLDADHGAARADEVRKQQGHVSGAAPDIQDLHAGGDAGVREELAGEGAVDLGLTDEPRG